MADQSSDETLRQLLGGFNTMQQRLGLLPMQQAQAMAGAGSQFQAPPPPPPMIHPADAAVQAMQQQQMMIQQTLQAAQVTRYQPPPSAPMPSVGAMAGFGMMNPFAAQAAGGGSFAGGGGGSGGGFSPMGAGRFPSVFNPFAPTLPQSHFAPPAMRNLQMMQHHQSQMMGAATGAGEMAMGLGGSTIGGAIGSLFGPLGSIAGSFLGNKIGGAISSMVFNPVTQDFARGHQIQAMTSPFMVTGGNLNMATGQGMDPRAARQTATGLRHLQRDYDFERTGFNSQDTMKIMQMSAESGLLTGANSPDQLVQKVKDISKMVKSLVRMGGDPDVQAAIRDLGQMRDLGFQGLGAQGGALANRMMLSKQAGYSQATMNAIGMGGAQTAGQFGLVGATGYMSAMSGAASANIAASSGALGDLQLARAGGRMGLGQTFSQMSLAGMNDEYSLLAGSRIGAGGKLEADVGAYRRAQGMSHAELMRESAEKLRELQIHGISDWNTRKQEIKDQIAQQMKPGEMFMNALNQASVFQKAVPGLTLGSALQSRLGMGAEQSQDVVNAVSKHEFWAGQIQQAQAEQREVIDQDRARRARYRTPSGLGTIAGQSLREGLGSFSDTVGAPFRGLGQRIEDASLDEEAASYGQRRVHVSSLAVAHNAAERGLMFSDKKFGAAYRSGRQGPSISGNSGDFGGRQMNRIGSFLGLSSTSDANRIVELANQSQGHLYGHNWSMSFGNVEEAQARVADVSGAAQVIQASRSMNAEARAAVDTKLDSFTHGRGSATIDAAVARLTSKITTMTAGFHTATSATALGLKDIRESFLHDAVDKVAAGKQFDEDPSIGARIVRQAAGAGPKFAEVLNKSEEIGLKAGAIDPNTRSREGMARRLKQLQESAGIHFEWMSSSEKTAGKSLLANASQLEVAMAANIHELQNGNTYQKGQAKEELNRLRAQPGGNKAYQSAMDIVESVGKDAGPILHQMAGPGSMSAAKQAKEWYGDTEQEAATDALRQRLTDVGGSRMADFADPMEAIKHLTTADLKKMTPQERARFEKVRNAKSDSEAQTAYEDVVKAAAPTQEDTLYGGTRGLDQKIEDLRDAEKKYADSGDSTAEGSAQFAAMDAFATSVKDFSRAVDTLTANTDGPSWQSIFGGSH